MIGKNESYETWFKKQSPRTRALCRAYDGAHKVRAAARRARMIIPRQRSADKNDPYIQLAINDIDELIVDVDKAVSKLRNLWGASMYKDKQASEAQEAEEIDPAEEVET